MKKELTKKELNKVAGGAAVCVKEDESLESALRRYKRTCDKAGIQQEIRKREHYEKPYIKKKTKAAAARKRKF